METCAEKPARASASAGSMLTQGLMMYAHAFALCRWGWGEPSCAPLGRVIVGLRYKGERLLVLAACPIWRVQLCKGEMGGGSIWAKLHNDRDPAAQTKSNSEQAARTAS